VAWKVGCDPEAGSNHGVWRAAGSPPSSWTKATGIAGDRIATNSVGIPYVAKFDGSIWRGSTSSATTGWNSLPGWAWDIGIADGNYAWMTGNSASTGGGYSLNVFQEQASGPGAPAAPSKTEWLWYDEGFTEVAVMPGGKPFVVRANGTVWTTEK
jgi:hypothetical protein